MLLFAQENKRFCKELGIEFIDCDYDSENWYGKSLCLFCREDLYHVKKMCT